MHLLVAVAALALAAVTPFLSVGPDPDPASLEDPVDTVETPAEPKND